MKKIAIMILGLMFTSTLVLSTPAIAAKRPPKNLCFSGNVVGGFSLAFKKVVKIRDSEGRKTYYAVHGEWNNHYPVTGTAYFDRDDPDLLKITFSGSRFTEFRSFYLEWDVELDNGYIWGLYHLPAGITAFDQDVNSFVCRDNDVLD